MMDGLGNCLDDGQRLVDRLGNSLEDRVGEDGLVSDDRDGGDWPELGGQLQGRGLGPGEAGGEGWLMVVATIAAIVTIAAIATVAEPPGKAGQGAGPVSE